MQHIYQLYDQHLTHFPVPSSKISNTPSDLRQNLWGRKRSSM